MWPGDQQSGGENNPQGAPPPSNPYPPTQPYGQPAQPYETPSPYAQPGYQQPAQPPAAPGTPPPGYQQPPPPPPQQQAYAPTQAYGQPAASYDTPSPYAQPGYQQQPPGGYPTPQAWGPPVPGGPEGGPPDNRKRNIGIAVVAAVAVIAAVVGGVLYTRGGSKDEAGKDKSPTATAPKSPTATATSTPSPTATSTDVPGDTGDDPRGAPGSTDVKAVVPGWKVVKRTLRNVAFDVPPDWTVDSESMTIGFTDKSDQPAVAMGAPAYYKHAWCKSGSSSSDRAAAGTKGANGATSVRNAAEVQATAWAYWAYQTNGKGTFSKVQNSKPFTNAYGISGWQASATASNLVKANKCSSPGGAAYTVAWSDPTQTDPTKKLVVWVLYCDRGVSDQLSQSVIDKIKSSIRPLKK